MDEYITDDGFWLYRKSRLNYYGVTALMARVYLCQEKSDRCVGMCPGSD